MDQVLIVGAGPCGSVAALVLARAGVRVRVVDRAAFPRDKLCGDTINPGTMALLRRLGVAGRVEARGGAVRGMRVTGPTGVSIEGRYPAAMTGRAIVRRELDAILLEAAVAAGAAFDPCVAAVGPQVAGGRVDGVRIRSAAGESVLTAPVTIAADGRHSTLAFALGLARHPPAVRRWAIGAYFADVAGLSDVGEMHVRRGHYIGVAPVPGGIVNVCLVTTGQRAEFRDPAALLVRTLLGDRLLGDRFVRSRPVAKPTVLGPLAVDASAAGIDGLLVAGDAAGFIDPMTGDGLRFAVRGGELAAAAAIDALERGWPGVHARHAAARERDFAMKRRFNRSLRRLVGTPAAVGIAAYAARVAPPMLRMLVRRAGDCGRR